ncbi:phytanoyl-CoA dioxygenase family protein [Acidisoma sp.]|uniref:phytanoyl-CoA dioxygenase family protein n=1 Tax=Acidisoma sp. TaxID=1872115 RepID=UPI003AFF7973
MNHITTSVVAETLPNEQEVARRFTENGFVQIDDVASLGEVQLIRQRLEEMWAAKTGFERGYQFDLVGDDDENKALSFPQIIHPSSFAPELLKTAFFARSQQLAKDILGPNARFFADHALLKPAEIGPETPWHQDEAFRDPAYDYKDLSIWLALQPTDDLNGCMKFMRGSHTWGLLPHRPLNGNEKIHAVECIGDFDASGAVPCHLQTGGCTIHGGRTLHSAGPNRSSKPRAAWVLIFEVPPHLRASPKAGAGVSNMTARAEREMRWQRRGGAVTTLWRNFRRVNLRDPRDVAMFLKRAWNGALRVLGKRTEAS